MRAYCRRDGLPIIHALPPRCPLSVANVHAAIMALLDGSRAVVPQKTTDATQIVPRVGSAWHSVCNAPHGSDAHAHGLRVLRYADACIECQGARDGSRHERVQRLRANAMMAPKDASPPPQYAVKVSKNGGQQRRKCIRRSNIT